jgi:peptidylglycine monooxygenase
MQDMVVALGAQLFRINRSWAKVPSGFPMGTFSKGVCATDGTLFLTHRGGDPVLVFGPDGHLVRSFGKDRIVDPHGITLHPDGSVCVVDRDRHCVEYYDQAGRHLHTLGDGKPRFQEPFSHPTDVAIARDGTTFIADGYGNAMVHRFSAAGVHETSWGGFGSSRGQFATPHGIWLLDQNTLLVGDRENGRVQIFDRDGNATGVWKGFYGPMDIYGGPTGTVYVSDAVPSLQARNTKGEVIGRCKPAIAMPHGLAGDLAGNIYVVETRNQVITRLEPIQQ